MPKVVQISANFAMLLFHKVSRCKPSLAELHSDASYRTPNRRIRGLLTLTTLLFCSLVYGQDAFKSANITFDWHEDPAQQTEQLGNLNTRIQEMLNDAPTDFCFEIETSPQNLLDVPTINCSFGDATAPNGFTGSITDFALLLGETAFDYDSRVPHTLTLRAHANADTPANRTINSLVVTFELADFDEKPFLKDEAFAFVQSPAHAGETRYLEVGDAVMYSVHNLFDDPEGGAVVLPEETIEVCDTGIAGDFNEDSSRCFGYNDLPDEPDIVSLEKRGPLLIAKADGAGMNTAGVYWVKLYFGAADQNGNVTTREEGANVTIFVKRGVNDPPEFRGGASGFAISVNESPQGSLDATMIVPMPMGAWDATDLNSDANSSHRDTLEYSLVGAVENCMNTGARAIQFGEMCIGLVHAESGVALQGFFLDYESPVLASSKTLVVTLQASDGWDQTAVSIEIEILNINELYAHEDASNQAVLPSTVRLLQGRSRTFNLDDYFTDPEMDVVSYTVFANVAGELVNQSANQVTLTGVGTSSTNPIASYIVTVIATDGEIEVTRTMDVEVRNTNTPPRFEPAGVLGSEASIDENVPIGTAVSNLVQYADDDSNPDEIEVTLDSPAFDAIVAPYWDGTNVCAEASATCQRQENRIAVVTAQPINFERTPSYKVTLSLNDGYASSDPDIERYVEITINDVNDPPMAMGAVPQQSVAVQAMHSLSVGNYFSDEDVDDRVIIDATSSDPGIATVTTQGADQITLSGVAIGTATITLTGSDNARLAATQVFAVEVVANQPPVVNTEAYDELLPSDLEVVVNQPLELPLSRLFTDPDGDNVEVNVISDLPDVLLVALTGEGDDLVAVLLGRTEGQANLTFTGTDTSGNTTQEIRRIAVVTQPTPENQAPVLNQVAFDAALPTDKKLELRTYHEFKLGDLFTDPDEDAVTLSISSSNESVIRVSGNPSTSGSVFLIARAIGEADISVRATDTANNTTQAMARLSVVTSDDPDDNQPPVIDEDALRAALPAENMIAIPEFFEIDLETVFSDPDPNDRIARYEVSSSDSDVLLVILDQETILTAFARTAGESTLSIKAFDTQGAENATEVLITVTPASADALIYAAQTLDRGTPLVLNIAEKLPGLDQQNSNWTLNHQVHDSNVVHAHADGLKLTLTAVALGETHVKLTASDNAGHTTKSMFFVNVVNAPPMLVKPIAVQRISRVSDTTIDLNETFLDPDGEPLQLSTLTVNDSIVESNLEDGLLTIRGIAVGETIVAVTAIDTAGAATQTTFRVIVDNLSPQTTATLESIHLEVGGEPYQLTFTDWFVDDDEQLSYASTLSTSGVIEVIETPVDVKFVALKKGRVGLTLSATDPYGSSSTLTANITVGDEQLKEAAEKSLGSLGRVMLASTTNTIGARANKARNVLDESNDAWHAMSTETWLSNHSQSVDFQIFKQATNPSSVSVTDGLTSHQPSPIAMGSTSPFSHGFSVKLGQSDTTAPWSLWSSMDRQSVSGPANDGVVANVYVGLDKPIGDAWVVGLAIANHHGDANSSFGTVTQHLTMKLKHLMPYVRFAPTDGTSVWGTIGLGSGDLNVLRHAVEEDASSLSSRLAVLAGRHRIASTTKFELALRGDIAANTLATTAGETASMSLTRDVQRIRGGLESSYSLDWSNGVTIEPFSEINFRLDRDGVDQDRGLELAGGLKLTYQALSIELSGRSFEVEGPQAFSERGMAMSATINPAMNGRGLSASISPRWGKNHYGASEIWATAVSSELGSGHSSSLHLEPRSNQMHVEAQLGYGFLTAAEKFIVTPFIAHVSANMLRQTSQFGVKFDQAARTKTTISSQIAVGRTVGLHDKAAANVQASIRLSF
ncbi:MAG: hypothetical protein F4W90_04930 [Gammaproteobacteria bacterium]|nr:hypothetical protein [Gammaproteobacteria bacterium]